ncbi:MAG: class I SAM-dependent methyltransferase [Alphaproteobacteria bacterium]|nr:class I SAM-dependent methyltransferase [Alphaproteobacteria bacterium]
MVKTHDMNRHFTDVSSVYRGVRTTDREPVERIAMVLKGLPCPKGADIGCGPGRYDLLMFETIPELHLTCIDANRAMLEQVRALLAAKGIDAFETRQSTVEELELEASAYDFVSSFNAVHHFDFRDFLRRSRDGLAASGHLLVYTRLPAQNARTIWGRYFPGFTKKETRLHELADMQRWIEDTPGLRFVNATSLRYPRRSSLERLVEQVRSRHYSTFALYEPDALEHALAVFQKRVRDRFNGTVEWYDENVLVHARRNND